MRRVASFCCVYFLYTCTLKETTTSAMTVQDLQKRVEALEVGATFDATQAAVKKQQMEMLRNLRDIRDAITMESSQGNTTASSSKEMQALKAENALLQHKVAKQEYRIQHLANAVEDLLAKRER
jgi:formate-dependent nitrite reductase cytochrome c552 subunit